MRPCFCDDPEDLVIFRFVDGSEEELSDEELVEATQSQIKYDPDNTNNEDVSDQETPSDRKQAKDKDVTQRQKRQNERRRRVREMQLLGSPLLAQYDENEEYQFDTDHEVEKGKLELQKEKQETHTVAEFYNQLDLVTQHKRKEAMLKNATLNLEISQYLRQRLAKLRELEPQRKQQKPTEENKSIIERQAQEQASTHVALVKSHADLVERQERERKEAMGMSEQINMSMSEYFHARLELGRLRRSN